MTSMPESDWKVFRDLHPIARERFCERVLADVVGLAVRPSESSYQRYLAVSGAISERRKDFARVFNDFRRSTAILQLVAIQSRRLLTDAEMARFSETTRSKLEAIVEPSESD